MTYDDEAGGPRFSVPRNDPCPCGSGKKYKRCHGAAATSDTSGSTVKQGAEGAPSPPGSGTGVYSEYIKRGLTARDLERERRQQLSRIGELRDSAVLVYAARLSQMPVQARIEVAYEDILPFTDIVSGLTGRRLSVILETPGGIGEVGREMVEFLHERFEYVEFIVPGTAKSTGTIMVLGGNEILMGPGSSLGPIDAQLFQEASSSRLTPSSRVSNRLRTKP